MHGSDKDPSIRRTATDYSSSRTKRRELTPINLTAQKFTCQLCSFLATAYQQENEHRQKSSPFFLLLFCGRTKIEI